MNKVAIILLSLILALAVGVGGCTPHAGVSPPEILPEEPSFDLTPADIPEPPPDYSQVDIPDIPTASVVRVIDGDTIEVNIEGDFERVRYIGIDTPEIGQPCADDATEANRRLVEDRFVILKKDISERDKYGRLLRYVFVFPEPTVEEIIGSYGTSLPEIREVTYLISWIESGEPFLVNALLVGMGYAQVSTYPPDVEYQDYFLALQEEAVVAERGCWKPKPKPSETRYLYVGSINSNVYHYPDCVWAKKIYPENEIWFTSVEDAQAHGYRPCKVCKPPPFVV